jgi:hypothetical protein
MRKLEYCLHIYFKINFFYTSVFSFIGFNLKSIEV